MRKNKIFLNNLIFTFAITLLTLSVSAQHKQYIDFFQPREQVFFFGLIGQSNALGIAPDTQLPADLVADDTDLIEYNGFVAGWQTQTVKSNQFGLERRLMNLLKFRSTNKQYMHKYAVGGTNIYSDWAPGGTYYNGYLAQYNQAIVKAAPAPYALGYRMKWLILVIGESSTLDDPHAASMQSDLQTFWNAFKVDFSNLDPNIKLIIPSLSTQQTSLNATRLATVNAGIAAFAAANPTDVITFVQNEACQVDNLHYTGNLNTGYDNIARTIAPLIIRVSIN